MRELQVRRFIKNVFDSPFFAFLLFFIVLFLLNSVYGVYKKDRLARINTEDYRQQFASLETKRKELEKELLRLQSDSGKEEEIRRRLQLLKSGERSLVIVENNEYKEDLIIDDKAWYERIWEKFTGVLSY